MEKLSTAALVFGPTPGSSSSHERASGTVMPDSRSSDRPPTRSVMRRRMAWMRGAFCSGQVTPAMVASTSATGASRTASQSGQRRRSALKAAPDAAFRVRCDSSDDTNSLSGSRLWK